MQKWKLLPIPDQRDDERGFRDAVRLNSLGSLFFFCYYTLRKDRLAGFHKLIASSLEEEDLHKVLECPMGFFKTVLGTGLSIWWALPFSEIDEIQMRALGYNDQYISYMKGVHDQNTRTFISHEVEQRAIDMGKEVDQTYQQNDLFRHVFAEIIPDRNCVWNDRQKFQRQDKEREFDATTGTFTYKGVGQSLQGVHPLSTIQDDNFGKAAQDSMLKGDNRIGEDLIRWHRQLSTRLDTAKKESKTGLGRQLVIGNRWGHMDLNSWIKENQKHFTFETHSAEGGCCKYHPAGKSIFPKEWPWHRLKQKEKDLGPYDYAHMYLNKSVLPEECIFTEDMLRFYKYKPSNPKLGFDDERNILLLEHEVYNGQKIDDLQPGTLDLRMVVDLAHAKKIRRCDHCIIVAGYDPESARLYMLDLWAEKTGYGELVKKIFEKAIRWSIRDVHMEGVAAQNILKFHLDEMMRTSKYKFSVTELPYDNSENAKKNRIETLQPLGKNHQIWLHRSFKKFISQWNTYPAGLVDTLDTMGYVPKTLSAFTTKLQIREFMATQQSDFLNRSAGRGGY